MSPTCSLHEYRKKRDWLSEKLAETRALLATDAPQICIEIEPDRES